MTSNYDPVYGAVQNMLAKSQFQDGSAHYNCYCVLATPEKKYHHYWYRTMCASMLYYATVHGTQYGCSVAHAQNRQMEQYKYSQVEAECKV